jgi:hypothetical protein
MSVDLKELELTEKILEVIKDLASSQAEAGSALQAASAVVPLISSLPLVAPRTPQPRS